MQYAIYTEQGEIINIYDSYAEAERELKKWNMTNRKCYIDEYWP